MQFLRYFSNLLKKSFYKVNRANGRILYRVSVYFDVFLGLNIFNVSKGCRVESATFTFYVPSTVSGAQFEFKALPIPGDLLPVEVDSAGQRVASLIASLRNLTPSMEHLQNRTRNWSV